MMEAKKKQSILCLILKLDIYVLDDKVHDKIYQNWHHQVDDISP